MRNFIRFILKYYFFILFLIFQALSFYLLINYNHRYNQIFVNSSSKIVASILEISGSFTDYFTLKRSNEELARENAYLRAKLPDNKRDKDYYPLVEEMTDSVYYLYRPARVVNNSVNRLQNYLTINQGSSSGIVPEMGVISARGLVGVVRHVSPNYSTVISLLNSQLRVSAKLRDSDYFGSLAWDGQSEQYAILSEIPAHAPVSVGEAVVTSGFSAIFPDSILIGIIDDYEILHGEGFYQIKVKLSVDFKRLTYVEVVEKLSGDEQRELEKMTEDD